MSESDRSCGERSESGRRSGGEIEGVEQGEGARAPERPGTAERLRERLDRAIDAGGDPLQVLAELLAAERSEEASVALLDLSGQVIDGFHLKRLLGYGGMGATYLAQAPDGASVAFKVMMAGRDRARGRFESEAKVLSTLRHPHIAGYLAHGLREDGLGWLAMERIEGQSLEALFQELESGKPSGRIACALAEGCRRPIHETDAWRRRFVRLLIGVADALEHAHERGVVHRDVKPQNLLVRPDLSAVVVDFGIARDAFRPVSLTRTGMRVGTPGYMAPEQLAGRLGEIGARTDLFALGLVLWRGLFGRDLFASEEELVRYAARSRALLPGAAQQLGAQLRGVLYRALEPQPRYRYASARALGEDLKSLLSDRPVTAQAPGALARFGRSTMGRRAFLLVAGGGLFGAGFLAARRREPYLLKVDALNRGGYFWIGDDASQMRSLPYRPIEVEPGTYTIHYLYPETIHPKRYYDRATPFHPHYLSRQITIEPGPRRNYRETLLTIGADQYSEDGHFRGTANRPRMPAGEEEPPLDAPYALLRLATGLDSARFEIGKLGSPEPRWRFEPGYHWIPAGKDYWIRAIGPHGEEERIESVSCRPFERTELVLLGKNARLPHPDRFEFTWGTVFAPLPKELRLELEDGWVRWINGQQDPQGPDTEFRIRAALAVVVEDRDVAATIEITMPDDRRFRRLDLVIATEYRLRDVELSATWSLDDGSQGAMPFVLNDRGDTRRLLPFEIEASDRGARRCSLRFVARVRREPDDYSSIEVLGGMIGPSWGREHTGNFAALQVSAELLP